MTLAIPKRSRDAEQAAAPEDHVEESAVVSVEDQRPAKKVLSGKSMTALSKEAKPTPARRRSSNRSLDAATSLQIKRSHEANQERAYVAASRRADRSLEARVQSARAASEIHKRRTGKGFKITEEIVLKEEMYEEEEDDTPRPFRLLAAHLQTKSPYFNQRINAFLTNRVAMATLNHQREVERMFAQQFPNAQQVSQQLHQSMYYQSMQQQQQQQDHQDQQSDFASSGTPTPPTYSAHPSPAALRDRSSSEPRASINLYSSEPPRPSRHLSLEELYPETGHLVSAQANVAPTAVSGPGHSSLAADAPTVSAPQLTSSFTSDLSPEARMLASLDMNDPLTGVFLRDNLGQYGQAVETQPVTSGQPAFSPTGASYFPQFSNSDASPTSGHMPPDSQHADGHEAGHFKAGELGQGPSVMSAGLTVPGAFMQDSGAGPVTDEGLGFPVPDNDNSWLEFLNTEDVDPTGVNPSQSILPQATIDQILSC